MTITITGTATDGCRYTDLKLEASRVNYGRTPDPLAKLEDRLLGIHPVGNGKPVIFYIEQIEDFQVLE